MSKSIYIAGASAEAATIASFAEEVVRLGWVIALPWWEAFLRNAHVPGADRSVASDVRLQHAQADLSAVCRAGAVWLVVPSGSSTGAWVEFGAALAHGRHTVVSGDWRRTIFTELADERFDTHAEALRYLEVMK